MKEKYGADSERYKSAQNSVDAYGRAGVDNGVTIQVGDPGIKGAGAKVEVSNTTGAKTESNPTGQKITVTFASANLGMAGLVAHEGSHVADGSAWVKSGFSLKMNPTLYGGEFRALKVQGSIAEGMGWPYAPVRAGESHHFLYYSGWQEPLLNNMINRFLAVPKKDGGVYELTPESKKRSFVQPVKPK